MDYTINRVERKNEWRSRFATTPDGKDMVDYAIALQGEQGWIKLTQKIDSAPPREGSTIHGRILTEHDRDNNPYRKFKKENPEFGNTGSQGSHSSINAPVVNDQIGYIVQMLEELTGRREMVEEPKVDDQASKDPFDPFEGMGI